MQLELTIFTLGSALALVVGCSSQPVGTDENSGGGSGAAAGSSGVDLTPSACSAALRQSLSLVDEVSTATVAILSEASGERTLYLDASVGGLSNQDTHPWLYLALATGQAVPVTDLQALRSSAWDLALKRSVVRTNGGDSGPGRGGAIRIALPWDEVDRSTLGKQQLPQEAWFDENCEVMRDAAQELVTTFSGWSEYDAAEHVVSAAPDVVFVTASADGSLYKVALLDYYSTPTGGHGTVSGRYKVRVAPLP